MSDIALIKQKIDNSILPSIKEGKAILIIGEELFAKDGKSLQEQLFDFLSKRGQPPLFVQEEGLFSLRPENDALEIEGLTKLFYRDVVVAHQALFDQLAALPFHLVLSMNPDKGMLQAYQRANKEAEFMFYHRKERRELDKEPSVVTPLVFNLMGSLEEAESLVFTVADLFEYMMAALGKNEMPSILRQQIKKANNFIFLGFQFERWYTKLIVRLLGLKQGYFLQPSEQLSPYTKLFCAEHLRINIIEADVATFVHTLYQACEADGLLQKQDGGESLSPNVRLMKELERKIAQDLTEEVLEQLMEFWEEKDEDTYNQAVATASRLRSLEKKVKAGTISSGDETVQRNQIREAILSLIRSMKEV